MTHLKDCPFCGGCNIAGHTKEFESHYRSYRRCVDCDYELSDMAQSRSDSEHKADKKWNHRADLIKPEPVSDPYKLPEPVADLEAALNCTIEHLDGDYEGKIVVDREVFETLYEAAQGHLSPASPWDVNIGERGIIETTGYESHTQSLRPAVPREVIEKAYQVLRDTNDVFAGNSAFVDERDVASALAALKPYVEGKE